MLTRTAKDLISAGREAGRSIHHTVWSILYRQYSNVSPYSEKIFVFGGNVMEEDHTERTNLFSALGSFL